MKDRLEMDCHTGRKGKRPRIPFFLLFLGDDWRDCTDDDDDGGSGCFREWGFCLIEKQKQKQKQKQKKKKKDRERKKREDRSINQININSSRHVNQGKFSCKVHQFTSLRNTQQVHQISDLTYMQIYRKAHGSKWGSGPVACYSCYSCYSFDSFYSAMALYVRIDPCYN